MNDMGFKVVGHLMQKGATFIPPAPAGRVVKHPKQHGNRVDIVPAMCLLDTDTPNNQRLPYKRVL